MSDTVVPRVPMDGKELLRALMLQAHLSPADFAVRLGTPRLQSDIQAYLDGQVRNPSWATFRPVANFFNIRISALFDTAVAEQVALARGFVQPVVPGLDITDINIADIISMPPLHLAGSAANPVIPIYDVVVLLAAAVKPHGDEVRQAVCVLFMELMKTSISAEETLLIAARIEALL